MPQEARSRAPRRLCETAPARAGAVFVCSVVGLALSGAVLVAAPSSAPEVDVSPLAPRGGAAAPYRDGPPIGFAGGFGEDACQACHFEGEVNEAPGSVALEGVPERYVPGETYALLVTLTAPDLVVGGFMLTARVEGTGEQAGTLGPEPGHDLDVGVSADSETGVLYAHHRVSSSSAHDEEALRWTVMWIAPDAGTYDVLFHAAALAADGDDSASGDFVFTTEASTSAR